MSKHSTVMDVEEAITRLQALCERIPPLLQAIPQEELSAKPAPDKWSKKQVIGHLIDSATNNHHRFVRGQFEERPLISYDQNAWNAFSFYQDMDGNALIAFWEHYNRHLVALLKRIPPASYARQVRTAHGSGHPPDAPTEEAPDLAFLIVDYIAHLEHHLRQIVNY